MTTVVRRGLMAVLVLALGCAPAVLAGAPAAADPTQRDALYKAIGVDDVPADYIFLIDVSGSMQQGTDLYAAVKQSLRVLLATLSPKDDVSLITFADTTTVWEGPAGQSPDDVLAHLPAAATGRNTDIGAAIERGLDQLERPGAPAVATVVMLTDGKHAPPVGSHYPFTEGASWTALKTRAAALTKASLNTYAVPLRGETDAGLLSSVFPTANLAPTGSIGQLDATLNQPKVAVTAAKARGILGDETAHGLRVVWPTLTQLRPGAQRMTLTLHSETATLSLTATGLTVVADDPHLRVTLPADPVTVAPGASVDVPMTVDWEPGSPGFAPYSLARAQGRLTLRAELRSPFDEALHDDLGLLVNWPLVGNTTTVDGSAQLGRPLVWSLAGLVTLVIALLAFYTFWARARPRMSGQLRAWKPTTGQRFGSTTLRGHSVTLTAADLPGLPGIATVRGRPASTGGRAAVELEISYVPPDGESRKDLSRRCPHRDSTIVNGVQFGWDMPETGSGPATAAQPEVVRNR